MISAAILRQIARSGEDLSNVINFDNMQPLSPKEARIFLKNIPSVKANRQWRAFKIKARRKIVNMFSF
jgi:hypothetical protein